MKVPIPPAVAPLLAALCLLAALAAPAPASAAEIVEAATVESEITSPDTFRFRQKTSWGEAEIALEHVSLRYRLVTLFGEPVTSWHLKYRLGGIVLRRGNGGKVLVIRIDRDGDPLRSAFVRRTDAGRATIGQLVARSLLLLDVELYARMRSTLAAVFRPTPGVMSPEGVWSRDVPGSPSWDRLFVRSFEQASAGTKALSDTDYLRRDDAIAAWKQVTGSTAPAVDHFSLWNASFSIHTFLARLTELNPELVHEFLDDGAPDPERDFLRDQAAALLGAYSGAVEALRGDDGIPRDTESLKRRRDLTLSAFNTLNAEGLIDPGLYREFAAIWREDRLGALDRELADLAANAASTLQGAEDTSASETLLRRLAALGDRAGRRVKQLPPGFTGRLDRLRTMLEIRCFADDPGTHCGAPEEEAAKPAPAAPAKAAPWGPVVFYEGEGDARRAGFKDLAGNVVIPPRARYHRAGDFHEGYALVWNPETLGRIIGLDETPLTAGRFAEPIVATSGHGSGMVAITDDPDDSHERTWQVLDLDGKVVLTVRALNMHRFSAGLAMISVPPTEGRSLELWFIDTTGKRVLGPYTSASDFSEAGFAIVNPGSRAIDTTGKVHLEGLLEYPAVVGGRFVDARHEGGRAVRDILTGEVVIGPYDGRLSMNWRDGAWQFVITEAIDSVTVREADCGERALVRYRNKTQVYKLDGTKAGEEISEPVEYETQERFCLRLRRVVGD